MTGPFYSSFYFLKIPFARCSAFNSGGAIYATDSSNVQIQGNLTLNVAFGDGGGVSSTGRSGLVFGSGAVLQQNSAANRGGGAYIGGVGAIFGEDTCQATVTAKSICISFL